MVGSIGKIGSKICGILDFCIRVLVVEISPWCCSDDKTIMSELLLVLLLLLVVALVGVVRLASLESFLLRAVCKCMH